MYKFLQKVIFTWICWPLLILLLVWYKEKQIWIECDENFFFAPLSWNRNLKRFSHDWIQDYWGQTKKVHSIQLDSKLESFWLKIFRVNSVRKKISFDSLFDVVFFITQAPLTKIKTVLGQSDNEWPIHRLKSFVGMTHAFSYFVVSNLTQFDSSISVGSHPCRLYQNWEQLWKKAICFSYTFM